MVSFTITNDNCIDNAVSSKKCLIASIVIFQKLKMNQKTQKYHYT